MVTQNWLQSLAPLSGVFMSNYIDDNIDQIVFLDVDYMKVLGEKTFERCLFELVTHKLDLSAFHNVYKS